MNKIKLYSLANSLQWLAFSALERLTGYRKEKRKFKRASGYEINLKNPLSFEEKIVWKKIYDRNPLLPIITDKYMVRGYLKDILGEGDAEKILVPLFYVTDKPETIPFDNLPQEYIIKPNHASHRYIIVEKPKAVDRGQIISKCREWLIEPYGLRMHEWAYQKIKRKIVVEKLLRDESGNFPIDYKFYVFHGKCHLIQVVYGMLADKSFGYYTPEWEYLNIQRLVKSAERKPRPRSLGSMIGLAESLGAHFDFISVDLYLFNDKIYFGELTNYTGSGYFSWDPKSFGFELGEKWKIVPGYWKKDGYIKKCLT